MDSYEQMPSDGNWESLQQMPVPAWLDDGKIGIFIDWGLTMAIGYHKGGRGYGEHVPQANRFRAGSLRPEFTRTLERHCRSSDTIIAKPKYSLPRLTALLKNRINTITAVDQSGDV